MPLRQIHNCFTESSWHLFPLAINHYKLLHGEFSKTVFKNGSISSEKTQKFRSGPTIMRGVFTSEATLFFLLFWGGWKNMIALDELAVQSQHSAVVFVALWPCLFTISIPVSTASQWCDVNIKALQFQPAWHLFSQLTVYCSWAITRPSRVEHNRNNTNRNLISLWVVHCPFSLRGAREGGCVHECRSSIFGWTLYFIPQMILVFLPLKWSTQREGMQNYLIQLLLLAIALVLWCHGGTWLHARHLPAGLLIIEKYLQCS